MAKARKKLEWTFPEYTKQNHSLLWYIIAGIVAGLMRREPLVVKVRLLGKHWLQGERTSRAVAAGAGKTLANTA